MWNKVVLETPEKALHIRECCKRMAWLATVRSIDPADVSITNRASNLTSALLCNYAYAVALTIS